DPDARRKLTPADAETLREGHSPLDGHPNPMVGFPLFDAATGSLGQGLSVAAGVAEAARLDGIDKRVYCIIGDGEAREGQIAEALDHIVDHKLTNVLPIFNCNGHGQTSAVSTQQSPEVLQKKLEATGYRVMVIDGHAPEEIKGAFDAFAEISGDEKAQPMAVVAKTVKGWGSPTMSGANFHGKPATGDQLENVLAELSERRTELTSALVSSDSFTIQPPDQAPAPAGGAGDIPSFSDAMKARDMQTILQGGRLATRKAYGIALQTIGHHSPGVVALDADVSNSTFAEYFAKDPALMDRFVECKIAEQNMISVAAGLSAGGKVPFCSTFSRFVTRAYDQIEMAIVGGANLKVIGSHSGATLAADGPSQMSLPDVAWFRSLSTARNKDGNPLCYVLQPADAFAAYALTGVMAEYEGACYMRTVRNDVEFLYSDDVVFNLGGFEVLNEGRDILICAAGYMVHEANKAIDALDEAGVSASLVDLYSLPFDEEKLLDIANDNNGYVLTVEDNYGGGIGSAVADALTRSGEGFTLEQMHIERVPKSAKSPTAVLEMVGLSSEQIAQRALEVLQVAAV
ncbi:MAG: transketolase, partial [Planctomycetota bacterium]